MLLTFVRDAVSSACFLSGQCMLASVAAYLVCFGAPFRLIAAECFLAFWIIQTNFRLSGYTRSFRTSTMTTNFHFCLNCYRLVQRLDSSTSMTFAMFLWRMAHELATWAANSVVPTQHRRMQPIDSASLKTHRTITINSVGWDVCKLPCTVCDIVNACCSGTRLSGCRFH